ITCSNGRQTRLIANWRKSSVKNSSAAHWRAVKLVTALNAARNFAALLHSAARARKDLRQPARTTTTASTYKPRHPSGAGDSLTTNKRLQGPRIFTRRKTL